MFMSFWRKRQIADKVAKDVEDGKVLPFPEPKEVPPMPKVEDPKASSEDDKPVYQIGKLADGRVTLRVGSNYSWTTITMNNQAVDGLVRMLEAAKEPEDDDGNPVNDYV